MVRAIQTVAVLGAGVMGGAIAAHLANVGRQVLLLDVAPRELTGQEAARGLTLADRAVRNRLAEQAKAGLLTAKPSPLYLPEGVERIETGNLEDDLGRLAEADWIIEAVVERLEVKKELLRKVEAHCRPDAIISSNTSGISINEMAAEAGEDFRKRFLGTHFFNPPRYMKLLELIPGRDTDPEIVAFLGRFAEKVLGKGVVLAKDTPNFIANRIGAYGLMATLQTMGRYGLTVEEVDALTGPVLGRPKSASFRTLDLVGLDTFVHVAGNVRGHSQDPAERETFTIPGFLEEMVAKGWLGDKGGQGFYKKVKGNGGSEILVLDPATLEYRPKKKAAFPSLEGAKGAGTLREKLAVLVSGKDRGAQFAWELLKRILLYSADKMEEIAGDVVSVDRAMRWGFNWELGPFETWDALGLKKTADRMKDEGETLPPWVEKLLASGQKGFYSREGRRTFYMDLKACRQPVEEVKERIAIASLREDGKVVLANPGATLYDMGDDVALLEFHSPKQAIGVDFIQMVQKSLGEAERNFKGIVLGNEAPNFCVGANLLLILLEAEDENWEEIDWMVRQFQGAAMAVKYAKRPVVAAPHGMTLGGGCEFTMPAAAIQAAAETYIGLVEVGVGLIPGGSGHKELLLRAMDEAKVGDRDDLQPVVSRVFETIAMAKVSTSAQEARKLGYLRSGDGISVNVDFLLHDAKQKVLKLWEDGYAPPLARKVRVVGAPGQALLKLGAYAFHQAGQISDHDLKIVGKIAQVLSGGNVSANTLVGEEYLLDLEREAFLSLVGEAKTQERMRHMLAKGKPLRN